MLLLTIVSLIYSVAAGKDSVDCFTVKRSYRIHCAIPVDKRSPISLAECREWCLSRPADCLAAQYSYRKVCELFDVPSPLDLDNPGSVGRYRRQMPTGDSGIKSCSPTMKRSFLDTHLIPKMECLVPEDKTNVRLHEATRRSQFEVGPIPIGQTGSGGPDQDQPPPRNPFSQQTVEVLPIVPDCPIGERARTQLIDGVDIATQANVVFSVNKADKCIEACRTSSFPDGKRLPLLCRSATYHSRSEQCCVHHDALNPNGYLDYKPDPEVLYMEKICIPDALLSVSCDDVFRRVPQHILLGHAAEIITTASQAECIRECIAAKLRNFNCRSVLHYIDVPLQNCILNIHTRNTRAEFFMPELRYKVDYIELSPCASMPVANDGRTTVDVSSINQGNSLHIDNTPMNVVKPAVFPPGVASVESEWSEWTVCDPSSGLRERDRECQGCKETIQSEPCFSNDHHEFDSALKEYLKKKEMDGDESEKAGFEPKTKIIPFPSKEVVQGRLPSVNDVEFFGPPLPAHSDVSANQNQPPPPPQTNNLRRIMIRRN